MSPLKRTSYGYSKPLPTIALRPGVPCSLDAATALTALVNTDQRTGAQTLELRLITDGGWALQHRCEFAFGSTGQLGELCAFHFGSYLDEHGRVQIVELLLTPAPSHPATR